jgi:hypothetical protein
MCTATNAVSRKAELTMRVEVVHAIKGGSWKWRTGLSEGRRQGSRRWFATGRAEHRLLVKIIERPS